MIIGVTGGIGSGKSTVAHTLKTDHGFKMIEFSDKLKRICADLFGYAYGVDAAHFWGTQADKNAPLLGMHGPDGAALTGRRILEHVGTEGFRAICPDVWTRYVFTQIDREGGDWVIPGLRFPNEAEDVWARGGEVWRVECVGGPNEGAATGHESDEAWRSIGPDYVLRAEFGNLAKLRELVRGRLSGV